MREGTHKSSDDVENSEYDENAEVKRPLTRTYQLSEDVFRNNT